MSYNAFPSIMKQAGSSPRATPEKRNGQSALFLAILIGGLIILIAATIAFLVFTFISSSLGFRAATRAQNVAAAGVDDALIRLIRNKDFASASPYALLLDGSSAAITVLRTQGKATIFSTASVAGYTRGIRAVASVDQATGEVNVVSREQAAF